MSKMKTYILAAWSTLILLATYIILLALLLFFIIKPDIWNNTKSIVISVYHFLASAGITIHLKKVITKGMHDSGSLSGALNNLLINEPLLRRAMFIFVLFQLVLFSFLLPVHSLCVDIVDLSQSEILQRSEIQDIALIRNGASFQMDPLSDSKAVYEWTEELTWGDSIQIYVDAKGYQKDTILVAWSAFACFDLVRGMKRRIYLKRERPLSIEIRVENQLSAQIHVRSPIDTLFTGVAMIQTTTGKKVDIHVSLRHYIPWDTLFFAEKEMKKSLRLRQKPGRIIFRAFNEFDMEYQGMNITIDDALIREQSGEVVKRIPGWYFVSMEKVLSEHERAIVNSQRVHIKASDSIQEKCFKAIVVN